jgi:hypothetical protein
VVEWLEEPLEQVVMVASQELAGAVVVVASRVQHQALAEMVHAGNYGL